jgi:hypothetical protein
VCSSSLCEASRRQARASETFSSHVSTSAGLCLSQELTITCTIGTFFLQVNSYILLQIDPRAKAQGLYLVNSSSYKTDRLVLEPPRGISRRTQNKQMRPCPSPSSDMSPTFAICSQLQYSHSSSTIISSSLDPLQAPFHTPVARGWSLREPLPVKCATK